ncbi:phosphatidylserine decarboxylase [Evansella cellulosilytica]|uniref:phosphatidylserine decarboxylase n=1 Tax=Evansella cellulosilytica (strain ATCC 21833 / DSM 2522 / FERM P-1141 / JCM 9156 / N-4) TaxID=649639 RepID=E6TVZ7_EVAC2|nr:phosphatidylserine decarboxylase [Evansella cellulosilytica]ADU29820.1 phosphatidylserine decarboxylase [Evansella cellulosilytica DSM 2522]
MKKHLYKAMVQLTNNPIYSDILKRFATSKMSGKLNQSFVNAFNINQEELQYEINHYPTIHDFFIRQLKEGAREVDVSPSSVVSPVDGVLTEWGTIDEKANFYVKENDYPLKKLLGLKNTTRRYIGGTYMVFYLSPKDYHRIHSPIKAKVVKRWALGKYSEPVNKMGLLLGEKPLANNYRLITELKVEQKHVALAKIGALNVNSVHASHLKPQLEKGEELGYFSFGSSVVLLFEAGLIKTAFATDEQDIMIRQGEKIGTLV